jgi:hypothetical protein
MKFARVPALGALFVAGALLLSACASAAGTPGAAPASLVPTRPATATFPPEATHAPGCTVVSKQPTPTPISNSIVPPITSGDWTSGPADARITIIEYSDFQ